MAIVSVVDAIQLCLQTEITQLRRKTLIQSINPENAYRKLKSCILPRVGSYSVLDAFLLGFYITVTEFKKW